MTALMFVATAAVGSTRYLNVPVGRQLRWAVLGELAVLAGIYAFSRGRVPRAALVPGVPAAALAALAAVSTFWSPDPRLTLLRAGSLALLFAAAGGLALGAAGDLRAVGRLLLAVLAGAVAVALAGLVLLAVRPDHAAISANLQSPWRYSGLGGNPNTAPMLFALALPVAVWLLAVARSRRLRLATGASIILLVGSIVASGSRTALAASLAGTVLALAGARGTRKRRALLGMCAAAVFVAAVGITQIPQPASHAATPAPARPSNDAEGRLPLEDELGRPAHGSNRYRRSLFSSGGRLEAWRGALGQASDRPVLGYGFGTEEKVFVDRYYLFDSSRAENAYIGTFLQVGAVGLAVLAALLGAVLVQAARAVRRLDEPGRRLAAAVAGSVLSGLVLAVSQSYLTSAGSPAAPVFWLCFFLLAAVSVRPSASATSAR